MYRRSVNCGREKGRFLEMLDNMSKCWCGVNDDVGYKRCFVGIAGWDDEGGGPKVFGEERSRKRAWNGTKGAVESELAKEE